MVEQIINNDLTRIGVWPISENKVENLEEEIKKGNFIMSLDQLRERFGNCAEFGKPYRENGKLYVEVYKKFGVSD